MRHAFRLTWEFLGKAGHEKCDADRSKTSEERSDPPGAHPARVVRLNRNPASATTIS